LAAIPRSGSRCPREIGEGRGMVAKGQSPAKAKQEDSTAAKVARKNTLRTFGEDWYAVRAKGRSESWKGNARRWLDQDIYPALGTAHQGYCADDVERLVKQIARSGGNVGALRPPRAFRRLQVAAPVLGVGNPARDVAGAIELPKASRVAGRSVRKRYRLSSRRRPLPGRDSTKLAIRLLMLTFVRKLELIEVKWMRSTFEAGEWVIPASA